MPEEVRVPQGPTARKQSIPRTRQQTRSHGPVCKLDGAIDQLGVTSPRVPTTERWRTANPQR